MRLRTLLLTLCLLAAAVLVAAPLRPANHAPGGVVAARVTRVVDGDTIKVALPRGRSDTVRYIGMDTPETKRPGTPVQCYGHAASAANARMVSGRAVLLRFDAERRDRYGRLLAYVQRRSDGVFVNAELVRRGYARPLMIPPNVRHAAAFARLARRAKRAARGQWGRCSAITSAP
jgi:micrococcal nuclease